VAPGAVESGGGPIGKRAIKKGTTLARAAKTGVSGGIIENHYRNHYSGVTSITW